MPGTSFVVHAHFYQPPRENPWTETVAAEPSAAPFHDWNARITEECYRPNAWARVLDEQGRIVALVDNYAHLSFNVGPTLLSWLEEHAPDVVERMVAGDRVGGGAIAQAYNHLILPLATERDVRTQVRWGLADFRHRFGREPEGMWLPEAAVDDRVLRIIAEEGVSFTILAPDQATRVRRSGDDRLFDEGTWVDVAGGSIDSRRAYRWQDPERPDLGVDIVFYDGRLSHEVAFGMGTVSAQGLVERARSAAGDGDGEPDPRLVCVATDGETFGHHHPFAERALAYALPVEAPRAGMSVPNLADHLRRHPPTWQVEVRESSWSCAHGVGRWREDCGCSTGGAPGADQRWRAPLRAALDVLRDAGIEVFERRGGAALLDPWAARDAYIEVVLGTRSVEELAAEHVKGAGADEELLVEALTLLEQQRHAMLMYTSCAWFFWDLAGLETVQCLRYAARALDLLVELGEEPPLERFLDLLGQAASNQPGEGTGRDVWQRHVEPARVDARRVVAHLALADLLAETPSGRPQVGATFEVEHLDHAHADRGGVSLCSGTVALRHRRTRRRWRHTYAALHLGGLEVLGAVRPADPERDPEVLGSLRRAFDEGERVTTLLRLLADGLGPDEFGLESALPDAADELVAGAADALAERFGAAYERLFTDNRAMLGALATAGYSLPPALRAPAELALTRRFEAEISAQRGSWDPLAYDAAIALAREAEEHHVRIDSPRAKAALTSTLLHAVDRAVAGEEEAVEAALALLGLANGLGMSLEIDRAQERVYQALTSGPDGPGLQHLGRALGLAVGDLGIPPVG